MVMEVVFHDLFSGSGQLSGRLPDTVGAVPWTAPADIWPVASGYTVDEYAAWNSFTSVAHPAADFLDAEVYVNYTVTTPASNESVLAIWFRSDITASAPDYLVARNRLLLKFSYLGLNSWNVINENQNVVAGGVLPHGVGTHTARISMVGQDISIYFNEVLAHSFTALVWPESVSGIQSIAGAWGVTTGWFSAVTDVKINEFRLSGTPPPPPILQFWTNNSGQSETGYDA